MNPLEFQYCDQDNPCDAEDCQSCCEHDETDHGVCCDCGLDISDELCNRAHEYFEGDR